MSSPSQTIIIKNPDGSTGQITVTANGLKCDVVLEAQNVTIGNIHLQDGVNAAYVLKIDSNGKIGISSVPTGTAVTANSTPITLASDDPIAVAIKNAVANILPKGQATMANSAPVVLASDQSGVPLQSPQKLATIATFTVPDAYATGIAGPIAVSLYGIIRIKVREIGGSYGLKFKVLAGPSSVTADLDILNINGNTETSVAASGSSSITINGPHCYIDVQLKNATAGSAATAKIDITVGQSNTNLQLPAGLGQTTMAASMPVALANDQTPPVVPAIFSVDVTVTTNAAISADTVARDEVLLMADLSNTDTIKVGVSTPTFPLAPGFWVAIRKTQLSLIFAAANSGSQVLHVLCGGS